MNIYIYLLYVYACLCLGSGYKVSVLASLSEGQTLMIGGKEVEVMGVIAAEDFARGRCFQEVQMEKEEPQTKAVLPPPRRFASKPFSPPTLVGRAEHPGSKPVEEQTSRPRHDPQAPGVQTNVQNRFCLIRHSIGCMCCCSTFFLSYFVYCVFIVHPQAHW